MNFILASLFVLALKYKSFTLSPYRSIIELPKKRLDFSWILYYNKLTENPEFYVEGILSSGNYN